MSLKLKVFPIYCWMVAWMFVAGANFARAAEEKPLEPKVVEVLPGIFTLVHGSGIDSNSTFIITREGVIVIDTRVNPAEARTLMDEIRKRTDLPIVYTINTHFHGDHTFGNQVFRGSPIIAHKNVYETLVGLRGKEHLEKFKTFGLSGMDEVQLTPPNLIYEGNLEIFLGGIHLQLNHRGRGHTDGDTYIVLSELRAVITGDLVFNGKIPYLGDAFVEDWINTLDAMTGLHVETVIPGHGDVGDKPLIMGMRSYLVHLRDQVKEQIGKNKTLKETQDAVRPKIQERYKAWLQQDWIDANIERAYLEYSLAGQPGVNN